MKPQRIEKYKFTANDNLLLDANVWLFLYCPHGDPNAYGPRVYSAAFKNIISAKSRVYVNSTVLGEFVNRYCRLVHELMLAKDAAPRDFKRFRKTVHFQKVARAVADAAQRVLKDATPIDDDFASLDVGKILADFETSRNDFNDLLIAEVCGRRKLTLVTDDEDFLFSGIPVLTANVLLAN